MRVFLAIKIPETLREKLGTVLSEVPKDGVRIVSPQNYHLTLRFFGEIKEPQVEEIRKKLKIIKFEPFVLELAKVGVFPSVSEVRTIWAGAKGKGLAGIMESIDALFPSEEPFTGHVTLARVQKRMDGTALVKKYQQVSFGKFEVEAVVLMKSEVAPTGIVYSVIEELRGDKK